MRFLGVVAKARRRLGRLVALGVALAAGVLLVPVLGGTGEAAPTGFTISPITASFVSSEFATHYSISLTAPAANANDKIMVTWTLNLVCIDTGCPNSGGTLANPQPDVDPGCNNNGVGTTNAYVQKDLAPGASGEFVWHHPGASEDPTGTYHCDHSKEGPRGHQGIITVVASDGQTQCTATFKGTVSSTPTSVSDGTASEPSCTSVTTTTTTTTTTTCPQSHPPPQCRFDLAAEISAPFEVSPGHQSVDVEWTVKVVNKGPAESFSGRVLVSSAYDGSDLAHGVPDATLSSTSADCSGSPDMVCKLPPLANGASVKYTLRAHVLTSRVARYDASELRLAANAGTAGPESTSCDLDFETTCRNNHADDFVEFAVSARVDEIKRQLKAGDLKQVSGTAAAPGKSSDTTVGARAIGSGSGIRRVQIALLRLTGNARAATAHPKPVVCQWLSSANAAFVSRPATRGICLPTVWLTAHGTTRWVFTFKHTLPPGRYVLYARATTTAGVTDPSFSPRQHNELAFTLR